MTRMDAEYQKDRRDRIKKDKEEKKRLAIVRGNESRARRKSSTEFRRIDVAIEVNPTPVGLMEVEEKEEMEEDIDARGWS